MIIAMFLCMQRGMPTLQQPQVSIQRDLAIKRVFSKPAAARYKENISWMPLHLEMPFIVYQADRRGTPDSVPHKHSNSGREASAFLMFIAEYYDCLPEVSPSLFIAQRTPHFLSLQCCL